MHPRLLSYTRRAAVSALPEYFRGGIVQVPMHLTEILQPECVRVPLASAHKQQAIFELVEVLADHDQITDRGALRDAVWKREQTRTTGIGHGLAIPHGKTPGCGRLCMAVGLTKQPIDFGAIDGLPVELIILLASPADQTGPHIQALATISNLLTDADFRNELKKAPTADALYGMIEQREREAQEAK
jgi:mannitol/fructose-specific phosphotransferase system IIA component (Ntr-type)